MNDYLVHWLDARGKRYATSVVAARSFPAAQRKACRILDKTAGTYERNPLGASGFWVEDPR